MAVTPNESVKVRSILGAADLIKLAVMVGCTGAIVLSNFVSSLQTPHERARNYYNAKDSISSAQGKYERAAASALMLAEQAKSEEEFNNNFDSYKTLLLAAARSEQLWQQLKDSAPPLSRRFQKAAEESLSGIAAEREQAYKNWKLQYEEYVREQAARSVR